MDCLGMGSPKEWGPLGMGKPLNGEPLGVGISPGDVEFSWEWGALWEW